MAEPIKLTTDGLLLNWLKGVGEQVSVGDIIAEVEADKATVEIESPVGGVLLEIKAEVGEELKEGAVIATVGAAGESGGTAAPTQSAKPTPAVTEKAAPASTNNGSGADVAARTPDGRIKASPVARNMAEEKGIDLSTIEGSGPGGRIIKADIENYQPPAKPAQAPATGQTMVGQPTWGQIPQEDVEIIDISRMRRAIADNTILSKSNIPHFYVTMSIDVEPMLRVRKILNNSLTDEGIKISVNDMIIKAVALTLRQYPNLNSHYYGDQIVRHERVNVGVAVALPNNGLVNVVVKDADKRTLSDMAVANKAMYDRAREGRIKPDDVKGATFTVSNLGPFDVDHFGAIISPPESGILAVGTAKKVPVVLEDGTLGVGNRMNVTISVDHRVSDGAEGAEFLRYFKGLLENPMRMLV